MRTVYVIMAKHSSAHTQFVSFIAIDYVILLQQTH